MMKGRACGLMGLFLMLHGGYAAAADAADARAADALAAATERCTQMAELVSCAAALSMKPNDADLLVAEADVLVKLNRPGEAIGVYRNAQRAGAEESLVARRIAQAQLQREKVLNICMTQTGNAGVRACESAWLPGARDEVATFKRRGVLLQDDNPAAALDAYLSAARLAPKDLAVARAVVELSGSLDAKGASILLARGSALLTLSRPREAVVPLRQALQLAPDLGAARVQLQRAERAAKRTGGGGEAALPAGSAAPAVAPGTTADSSKSYSNDAPMTRTQ